MTVVRGHIYWVTVRTGVGRAGQWRQPDVSRETPTRAVSTHFGVRCAVMVGASRTTMQSGVRWQCHTGGDATTPYEPLLPPSQALTAVCAVYRASSALRGRTLGKSRVKAAATRCLCANRVLPASMDGRHVLWLVGREVDDAANAVANCTAVAAADVSREANTTDERGHIGSMCRRRQWLLG